MLMPLVASAEKVEIDGIWYELNSESKTAEVAINSSGKYKGSIVIPMYVSYENVQYSVTSIGDLVFNDCLSLASITIGNNVTRIGKWAFADCLHLTSITIPNSVVSIGNRAFSGCSRISSVTIGYSVKSIGNYAFYKCRRLTSVSIPNNVTSIGENAFKECSGLTSIISQNPTPPAITSTTFDSYTAVLKVPTGSKAAYQAADYWKNFENVEEIDVDGVQGIQVDKRQNTMVYDLNGRRLDAPTKGVSIINGRKVLVK